MGLELFVGPRELRRHCAQLIIQPWTTLSELFYIKPRGWIAPCSVLFEEYVIPADGMILYSESSVGLVILFFSGRLLVSWPASAWYWLGARGGDCLAKFALLGMRPHDCLHSKPPSSCIYLFFSWFFLTPGFIGVKFPFSCVFYDVPLDS
jgi:hypothetical protein